MLIKSRPDDLKTRFKKKFTGRIRAKKCELRFAKDWGSAVQMEVNWLHQYEHPHPNVPGTTGEANLENPEKSG